MPAKSNVPEVHQSHLEGGELSGHKPLLYADLPVAHRRTQRPASGGIPGYHPALPLICAAPALLREAAPVPRHGQGNHHKEKNKVTLHGKAML